MHHKKAIIAIADGLGDRPINLFQGLTPLQKAHTPNLDALAREGICGMMDLIAPGVPVGTDMGHLILFGGSPDDYPGRGPIEASGINMPIQDGDILFRCNFATIDEQGTIIDRRAGRINTGTAELAAAINGLHLSDGVTAYFTPATEHRGVLLLRGAALSDKVTDSDPKNPGIRRLSAEAEDGSAEARKTAAALNMFLEHSQGILSGHAINTERKKQGLYPANCVLTRGAGRFRTLESIPEKYGFTGCCVAAESTVLGVAKLLGFTVKTHPAFTANSSSDFARKAAMALEALKKNDIVFVHIKATDLAGHDNLPAEKCAAIESFDAMVGALRAGLPAGTYLALASDHSTPCEVREHSGDPVPVVIHGCGIRTDQVKTFDEIACAHGGLSRITGIDFSKILFDLMGYSKKKGN